MSEYNTVSGPAPSTKPVQQDIEEAQKPVSVLDSSLVTPEFGSPKQTTTPASTSAHQFISHQQHGNSSSRPTFSLRTRSASYPPTSIAISPGRSSSIHGILQKLHCFFSPRKLSRTSSEKKKPQHVDGPERVPPSTPPSASHVDMGIIATPGRSGQEYLEKVFRYLDENGDGKISPSELRSYMRTVGEELSAEDAEAVVESTDSDGDGLLVLDDFVKLVDVGGEEERTRDLKEAFRLYEMEGQGCITPKSLRRMLRRLGDTKTIEECKVMIQRFDLNRDGVLSFDEFKLMML